MADSSAKHPAPAPHVPKKSKRRLWIAVAVVLLPVLLAGGLLARYIRQTEPVDNTLVPAQVACEIRETFTNNKKSAITVANTSNVPAYIRVRLVSYWQTPSGAIAGKTSPSIAVTPGTNWIADTANSTYYYTLPVDPETGVTSDLLAADVELQMSSDGYIQVVKVLAEAIQAQPEAAVEAAWQYVTVDTTTGQLSQRP